MAGWIKISRELPNHWLWEDSERLKWWLDLLIMAAWEDKERFVGRQIIHLRRGQLIASLAFLRKRWKRSRNMILPFLKTLEREGMIEKTSANNISVITICNYERYQSSENRDNLLYIQNTDKQSVSCEYEEMTRDNLGDNLGDTIKEYKEIKKTTSSARARDEEYESSLIELMMESPVWVESIRMKFNLTEEQVKQRINDFALDQSCRETAHSGLNDIRRHFTDWLWKSEEKQKQQQKDENNRRNIRTTTAHGESANQTRESIDSERQRILAELGEL